MDSQPVTNFQQFLERDSLQQQKYASPGDLKEDETELLTGEDWPRVEELDIDEDSDKKIKLEGIISPGKRELQLLSDFVSKISSKLRLDSQRESIILVSEQIKDSSINQLQTSNADDAIKEDDGTIIFLTSVPIQVSQKRLDFAYVYNSQVVEAAVFPGFDSDFTKLPNELDVVTLIKKGIKKINDSGIYTRKISKKWANILCNSLSCQLLSDAFWYIWYHHVGPNEDVQKKLLERISSVFVNMLVNCSLSSHSKDEFFEIYPNVIAISIWYGFMEGFPKSQKHFDISFQTTICDYLSEWIMGIVPLSPWCLEWDAPDSILPIKSEASTAEKSTNGASNTHNPELAIFKPKNDHGEKVEKKQRESCTLGPSYKVKKHRFDIYQNSPIISKYLSSIGYRKSHGSIIVHRSQVIRETPDPNVPTYRQIISESIKNATAYFEDYKQKIKRASREKLSIINETNQYLTNEQSQQQKILNNPKLVKEKAHSVLQDMARLAKERKAKILAKRKHEKIII